MKNRKINIPNNKKIVAFTGHRDDWHCIGVKNKLSQVLEDLINMGYAIFYDGGYGAFDKKCVDAVLKLKCIYPHIKLIKILTYYHSNKEKYELTTFLMAQFCQTLKKSTTSKKSPNATSGLWTTATFLFAILKTPLTAALAGW